MKKSVLTPAVAINQALKAGNLKRAELAKKLGVSITTIDNLRQGRTGISNAMAKKLSRVFGQPVEYWNEIGANYAKKNGIKQRTIVEPLKKVSPAEIRMEKNGLALDLLIEFLKLAKEIGITEVKIG